jgi:hypothetical protein
LEKDKVVSGGKSGCQKITAMVLARKQNHLAVWEDAPDRYPKLDTVHTWHHYVRDHQFGRFEQGRLYSILSIECGEYGAAILPQNLGQGIGNDRLIIDHQDSRTIFTVSHHSSPFPSPRWPAIIHRRDIQRATTDAAVRP